MSKSRNDIVLRWAHLSAGNQRLQAMLGLVKPEVAIRETELDQDPMLLNCRNGTVDLQTGELLSHQREHRITKLAQVDYNPDAIAPNWERFINEIFSGNVRVIGYVQRFVGYSFTGLTTEQCMAFLHGDGANGKTTFINGIRGCLDDYAQEAPAEMLLEKKWSGIPNDIARLRGARLVTVSETAANSTVDEALIKRLTGGDRITARFLHAEFFEFDPTHKLWLVGNHKPTIAGSDHAIWRRIKLIPFERTFSKERQDPHLPTKLHAEREGILAWAVRGCLEWVKSGLAEPDEVRLATNAYQTEMDNVQRFVDECCKREIGISVAAGLLHSEYRDWAFKNGERPVTQQEFARRLSKKGFESKHTRDGNRYLGLTLLEAHERP